MADTSVTKVSACLHFSYAITKENNEVYSWGQGDNYVLGNRDDCNEYKPYKLDPRMFETNRVVQVACGSNHVVVLDVLLPSFSHSTHSDTMCLCGWLAPCCWSVS